MNDENNEVGSVDTTYNWDDRNDDWWGDYTNFENLVLTCGAQGGRPEPTFIWYIENNQVNIDSGIYVHLVVLDVPDESGFRAASLGAAGEDEVLKVGVVAPPIIVPVVPVVGGVNAAHLIVLVIHDVVGASVVSPDLKLVLVGL